MITVARTRFQPDRHLAVLVVLLLALAGCNSTDDGTADGGPAAGEGGGGASITMARATWDTGWMQAEIYRQLLEELDYEVSDPADLTRDAATFYPALAQGQVDLWANGWFPLHDIYLSRPLFTGQEISESIEVVGTQVEGGAVQGYLIDRATAEEMGITSMDDLSDPAVAAVFDIDGNGRADLQGCNEGWGCNLEITSQIEELGWGDNVEQVVGEYNDLLEDVQSRVEEGEPTLFYTWTPNWTIDVLQPGEDVVWLESTAREDVEESTEVDIEGCAGEEPCDLGWVVNDIRAVANPDFLDDNPVVRRLLEVVEIPLQDIADQNARMNEAGEYTDAQVAQDAADWIEDNRELVDGWLETARG
ncbi:glycine betaine/L-proline ABC transporter substrate-binding protein ProX [Euzebya tangerina]|uniref:glycine betaine/L-proline ABC transporter substrate-binding protein ProX n=1 Tax=Euzebya tangerina TaxID=591198 RepID=UPI000E318927|nr:glycine betaine/L-proline ABC transporter substrate-binding protein ProX [Euzebya tangerina]